MRYLTLGEAAAAYRLASQARPGQGAQEDEARCAPTPSPLAEPRSETADRPEPRTRSKR
jgi:hypothetical protein